MANLVTVKGLGEVVARFASARDEIPHAVNYALARAADEIRDVARSNVSGSQYNLSHDMWGIRSKMSKKMAFTSEVGYFTDEFNWHIKFYESGATRSNRGSIVGGHFMKDAGSNADSVATSKMNESIAYMLRKVGLT
jgi:hypothetical protein